MAELPDYLREFDDTAKTRQLIYDGCLEAVKNRFPIEDDTYRLELDDVHYDGTQDYSLEDQKQALLKSKNLRTSMKGKWRLIHKPTNSVLGEREDTIMQVPYYTDRGTIINNGNDYSIISQMRLRPGVYARRRRTGELESHFNIKSGTGRAFRFELEPESGSFKLTVGQSHVPLYPILKAIGVTDQDMMKYWGADIVAANAKQSDASALKKTYQRMAGARADANANPLAMGQFIKDAIGKYEVDPEIVARTMGVETDHVTPELMLRATQKLLDINRGDAQPDNRDNPRYANVLSIEDLLRERIDKDAGKLTKSLLYRVRRDRSLNRLPKNALTPYLDSFILGSGLTMPGEETNPLSNLTQMNRISRFGEGGIRSDDAVPMEAHDVHGDWMGFVDPVAGPEGLRIGVDVRASYRTFKGKDKKLYGEFINAKTGKEEFVDMGTAADRTVAFPGQDMSQPYVYAMKDDVPTKVPTNTVDYVVPSFAHLYGTNTNINPMPTAVQAGRQFYGSKFWEQYLPQVKGEVPLVDSLMPDGKTTFTEFYGRRIGTLRSPADGTVVSVKDNEIVVKDGTGKTHKTTLVSGLPFNRISSISYTPAVKVGQDVHKGDMLANSNYTDAKTGAINMGQNLRVAILPYNGQSVSGDTNILWRHSDGHVSFGPIQNITPGDGMESLTVDPDTLEQSYAQCNALMVHKPDTKMYLVKTRRGRQVKVTGSHSMMVYNGKTGIKELKTTDLVPGQHFLPVVAPVLPFGENDELRCESSRTHLNVKLDRDFGWLIGIFLSEGYVDLHNGAKIVDISCTESDIVSNLKRIATDLGLRHGYSTYKTNVNGKEHNQGKFKIYSSALATWINEHCGKGAENKYIPDITWTAPREFAEGLIDAYICGDGTIGKECRISTVSHQMAEGLCFLLGGLGIMATYRTQKARKHWKAEIIVRIFKEFCHLLPDITLKRKDDAAKKLAASVSTHSYDSIPLPELHCTHTFSKASSSRSRIRRLNNGRNDTLDILCDKPMWWDMVEEVVPIPSEEYVYDLDMRPTSTFVVNTGIVVHNSFEDAHVISETAAKRMATDRMYSTDVETRNGVTANKNKYIAAFPNKFTRQQFETLDDNGLAKVGTELHKGDPIVVAIGPKVLSSSDAQLGKLSKTLRNAFTDKAEIWEHDWPGVVTDAVLTSRGARVNVKTTPPVKVGDKLCYSDDTEVLTKDGWKNIADLTLEDKVCTLNPENNMFDYINPAQLEKYEHDEQMYSVQSDHIDLLVTLDHNMYADIGEGFKFYKASELVLKPTTYLKSGVNPSLEDEKHAMEEVVSWGEPAYVGCKYAADKLQQEYLHAGLSADVIYDGFKYKVIRTDNKVCVNADKQQDMVVSYEGFVYCCTMPKWHVIYVRRNGKACWSGNSGRFGLKGVVGRIVPDDEMPRDSATNQPYDMLVNPMGFLSRVAPGQLMEIALGKVAKHTGQQIRIPQLPPPEGWALWTQSQLDKYGLKDSTDIFDPATGKTIKNIGDGYMFVSAFHHLAEKKASARGTESSYTQDEQPAKGGHEGAKRMSGLDLYALLSHGATDVIKDYVTVRGTRNEQYWNALRLGLPIPEPGVPFIYDKFLNTLKAGGINVVEKGNITQILPLTDKDIDKLSGSRLITSSAMVDSDLEPVKGGLFDPGKTGGANGNFWSAIPLPEPVPNPIMEEPIRRVLGLTTKKLEAILSGEEQLNGKTGGEAIKEALSHIDIDDKIAQARLDIKNRRGSVRDNAVKVLGYLTSMKEQELQPSDWMISKVPVLPPKFRPASKLGDVIMVSDINDLYKEVIENAKNFEELHKDLPDSATTNERLNLYKSVKAAYGLGESITPEGQAKGLKGAIRQVIGSSPKFGMFQRKVISKTVDTVSRNAVTPDPNLDMDQVGIPEDSAWEMYKPFVMRALVRRGYPPVTAIKMLEERDATARQMLDQEMEKRPVMMDRAPTWHKFNIMAFKPSIVDSNTVHVSPLIVSGFNMDFNGDSILNPQVFACIGGKFVVAYMSEIIEQLIPEYSEEKAVDLFGKTTTFLRMKEKSMQILGLNPDGTTGFVDVEDISIHTSHGPVCYHVVTRGGLDGVFTAHHNFWGFDNNCNMVPVKTTDVGVGSLVPYATSFDLPEQEGQDNPPNDIPVNFDTGFWFGHYFGDGALTGREDTISQASNDSKLLDHLEEIAKTFMDVDAWREGNGCSSRWTSKKWYKWLEQYGKGAEGKRIPSWMICANREFRVGLLAGYLAAEGSVSTGEFVVECISRELLLQFKFIAQSLGCVCRLRKCRPERISKKTGEVLHETWILYVNTSTVADLGIQWPADSKSQKFAQAKVPTRRNFDLIPFPKCVVDLCYEQGKYLQTLRGEKRAKAVSDTSVKAESKQLKIARETGYCTRSFATKIATSFGLDLLDNEIAKKWVALINNTTLRWDVIEEYKQTERPEVTYDMSVPGMQAFAVDGTYLTHNTVNFHVPVSDKAVKQANEKMMPSQNLISLTDLRSARHPVSKEQILGLFNLTQPENNKPVKVFRTKEDAKMAYARGEIDMNDPIEVLRCKETSKA